jgi:hypothetical protein
VEHFEEAKNDPMRDKKERCICEGFQRKIMSIHFTVNLGLMYDALQELLEVS